MDKHLKDLKFLSVIKKITLEQLIKKLDNSFKQKGYPRWQQIAMARELNRRQKTLSKTDIIVGVVPGIVIIAIFSLGITWAMDSWKAGVFMVFCQTSFLIYYIVRVWKVWI